LVRAPAAAQRFDQQHAGVETIAEDGRRGSFVCERSRLSSDHFEVTGDARFVLIREDGYGLLRGLYGFVLNFGFAFENPQRGEVIFDLLKCGKKISPGSI
jgi:hypothetical protein